MIERDANRQIIHGARALAQMPIDPSDTARAIEQVRARLAPPPPRHRPLMWLVTSGIAAVMLIAAVLLISVPRPVSAAQQLNLAAVTTQRYRGWVHVTPVEDPKAGATSASVLVAIHFNTADGTIAVVFKVFQSLCVQMVEPARQQKLMYSALTNQLRVDTAPDEPATATMKRSAQLPLKLADLLAQMKARGEKPRVTQTRDEKLDRFELVMAETGSVIVWCDPESKLIRRMQSQVEGKPQVLEYRYGDPEIRDIYDLGVPRTVRVLDARQSATTTSRPVVFQEPDTSGLVKDDTTDLSELSARIQKRMSTGFGDGVVLECEELKGPSNEQGAITIRASQGGRMLRARYLVAPAMMFLGGPGFPPGWPKPKLEDVLATVGQSLPVQLYSYDGRTLWQNDPAHPGAFSGKATSAAFVSSYFRLAPELWAIAGIGPAFGMQKVEVLRDAYRPGLIVLHVKQSGPRDVDVTYWLDPARDDLPVQWIQRSNDIDPTALSTVIQKVFIEFAQSPDGHWYPTHWQERTARPPEPGVVDPHSYKECYRQMLPSAKLPEEWFADPNIRLKNARMPQFPSAP